MAFQWLGGLDPYQQQMFEDEAQAPASALSSLSSLVGLFGDEAEEGDYWNMGQSQNYDPNTFWTGG